MNTDSATDALADQEADALTQDQTNSSGVRRPRLDNLGPRVVSALVLMPLAIAAAFFGGPWLAAAAGAAVVIMSYEWARMSEPGAAHAVMWCVVGALGGVMLETWSLPLWGLAWAGAVGALSALRRQTWAHRIETFFGVVYVAAPCICFLWIRDFEPHGLWLIFALFGIVWAADMAAYFCGQLIGGPKLAPQLSPAKTWSGFAGGSLAGASAGLLAAWLLSGPWLAWALVGAVLAFIGLCGDLFESLLKRRVGVKDASRLIPGHGGFLDRLDGLMAASVTSAALLAVQPGFADFLIGVAP